MKRNDYILMAAAMAAQGFLSTYGDEAYFPDEKYHSNISNNCFNIAEKMADEAEKRGYLEESKD